MMNTASKKLVCCAVLIGVFSMSGCASIRKNSDVVRKWEDGHQKAKREESIAPYAGAALWTIPALISDVFMLPYYALEAMAETGAFDEAGERARQAERQRREQEAINRSAAAYYGNYNAAEQQRELEERLEKQRVQGQIDAFNRKEAAERTARQNRIAQAERDKAAKLRSKLENKADSLKDDWSDFEFRLVGAGRDLKRTEFSRLQSEYHSLETYQQSLNKQLEAAGLAALPDRSNDRWFDVGRRELQKRKEGKRKYLSGLHGPSGKDWAEHLVENIDGIKFYQRVRYRKWPDAAVDLAWRVENTTRSPYWHSLHESATTTHSKHYLWGGSTLSPGKSSTHEYVSYGEDRTNWSFEAFVRRED